MTATRTTCDTENSLVQAGRVKRCTVTVIVIIVCPISSKPLCKSDMYKRSSSVVSFSVDVTPKEICFESTNLPSVVG